MEDMRDSYKILVGKPEGRDYSRDIGVDWRAILEWILWKYCASCGVD
jgi:hypothetical protein